MLDFDMPKNQSSILKVIGVGGGGSNAVNHMYAQNIEAVDFIICNTDAQAIAQSNVPNKIQLGPHLTQGLGAGANPAIGRQATEESLDEIRKILEVNTKMAFITAGMGGGTGTGGAPILAKICKDLGILTVGIVTTPFSYEGKKRIAQAEEGIMSLKNHVDTLLVISNDKLRHQFGNLKMREAFAKADNVLATAAKCITDVINSTGQINVDFADVCTVMKDGGVAILGNATADGEDRAMKAIEGALNSPLLNDSEIKGAKWILININSAEGEFEQTMDEVEVIQNYMRTQAGEDTDVILGMGIDNNLGSAISITLIATGFDHKDPFAKVDAKAAEKEVKEEKIVMSLNIPSKENTPVLTQPSFQFENETTDKKVEEVILPVAEEPLVLKLTEEPKVEVPSKITGDKLSEKELFFEISSTSDQSPVIDFDLTLDTNPSQKPEQPTTVSSNSNSIINKEASNTSAHSSGNFPVKPVQIYAENQPVNSKSNAPEEPLPLQIKSKEDEPKIDMQVVVKETLPTTEDEPADKQSQPIMMSPVEEPAMQDETEDLRRRASERIAKLRNLSYNMNAADPNNEFETVPAYLRRNMEMHNQIADVESFYSNYTVKSDENNKGTVSTINKFLDGKKPD